MLQSSLHRWSELRPLSSRWLEALLSLFYPEVCQICRAQPAHPREGYVCSACWHQVRFIVPPHCQRCGLPFEGEIHQSFDCPNCQNQRIYFDAARAAVHATGVALDAIHRYKYSNGRWFEPFLADLLCRALRQWKEKECHEWDMLVPVPLHPVKRRERGFNQAEALARRVARALGGPVHANAVIRSVPTQSQTTLSRQERSRNMRDVFRLRRGADFSGARLLVIDDVLTTGATTNACARMLKKAGAKRVDVWTVARGV